VLKEVVVGLYVLLNAVGVKLKFEYCPATFPAVVAALLIALGTVNPAKPPNPCV
jgi:hypothetical protein